MFCLLFLLRMCFHGTWKNVLFQEQITHCIIISVQTSHKIKFIINFTYYVFIKKIDLMVLKNNKTVDFLNIYLFLKCKDVKTLNTWK